MQNKQNYNIIKISLGILVTRTVILTLVIQIKSGWNVKGFNNRR